MPISPDPVHTALIVLTSQHDVPSVLEMLCVAYVAGVSVPLVLFDVRLRRLPNRLVLPGIALAGVVAAVGALVVRSPAVAAVAPGTRVESASAVGSVAATGEQTMFTVWTVLVASVVFVAACASGMLGMGDVKLAVLLTAVLAPVAHRLDSAGGVWLMLLGFAVAAVSSGVAAATQIARQKLGPVRAGRGRRLGGAGPPAAAGRLADAGPAGSIRSAGAASSLAGARPPGIPLGPFLLLGFWVAFIVALTQPP